MKRPFSELSEIRDILGAALGIQRNLGMRNSILGMASHDLSNTKTTILGATPRAILGIDGNPHEKFSCAPAPARKSLSTEFTLRTLIFFSLLLLGKARKHTQKARIFLSAEALNSLGKSKKTRKFLAMKKARKFP